MKNQIPGLPPARAPETLADSQRRAKNPHCIILGVDHLLRPLYPGPNGKCGLANGRRGGNYCPRFLVGRLSYRKSWSPAAHHG